MYFIIYLVIIKNKKQKREYLEACKISVEILKEVYEAIEIGISPIDLDKLAGKLCEEKGVKPSFFDVPGRKGIYGYNSCIQINDVAVHGIPDANYNIKDGDLVTVDFGIIYKGYYTDHCVSVGVGNVSEENIKLLRVGKESVLSAIKQATSGNYTGDIGYTLENEAQKHNYDTLKEYIGHGIGESLHDDPEVPAYGNKGDGNLLKKGQVICIESQVVAGEPKVKTDTDGWTTRTRDGKNAVMFEYMVMVDNAKPLNMTPTQDWPLVK
jgi:methionyl aminopeptidase